MKENIMIWFKEYKLKDAADMIKEDNILGYLGLEFIDIGADYIKATMPVDQRTHQPYGILHGGATCVLAETLGSVSSLLVIDPNHKFAVGSVISTNHLRPVREGLVTGICRPIHLGRTKHVWEITVTSDRDKLIAKSELTCAVTPKFT
jgi:1,4-dihydroxy-2-naphthoyl-CoA hydrolase